VYLEAIWSLDDKIETRFAFITAMQSSEV